MPLNIDWQQILLHAFNLVLLFAILYLLLYKPVKNFMDKRSAEYQKMDEETKKNLAESEVSKKSYQEQLDKADAEIRTLREDSMKETAKLSENIVNEAKDEASHIIAEAKNQANRERSRILAGASEEISEMVQTAAAKIVFSDTDSAYEDFLNTVEEGDKNEQ